MGARLPLSLGIVSDFKEEGWPSMDITSKMLTDHIGLLPSNSIRATQFRARFLPICERVPIFSSSQAARKVDRYFNRFVVYPRELKKVRHHFDVFHIADHSYSHLVHSLKGAQVGIFCHDLDTFKCLLEPELEPRSFWFRSMTESILRGFNSAPLIFHTTQEMKKNIEAHGLAPKARFVHAPLGVEPIFFSKTEKSPSSVLRDWKSPYLIHVGSCIPRKRIEFLIDLFHGVLQSFPRLKLLQVGGDWSEGQRNKIEKLGLSEKIRQIRGISSEELSALYQGAEAMVFPSSAEGFGMPLIEALASGTAVFATDIPVLREVGESYMTFVPAQDSKSWIAAISQRLERGKNPVESEALRSYAKRFTWERHASAVEEGYLELLAKSPSEKS